MGLKIFDDRVGILFHWFGVLSHAVNRVRSTFKFVKKHIKTKKTESVKMQGTMHLQNLKRLEKAYGQIIHTSMLFSKKIRHQYVFLAKLRLGRLGAYILHLQRAHQATSQREGIELSAQSVQWKGKGRAIVRARFIIPTILTC